MNESEPTPPDDVSGDPRRAQLFSFRDPDGSVFSRDGRIFRRLNPQASRALEAYFASPTVLRFVESGRLVRTWVPADQLDCHTPSDSAILLEHERIDFPTFPYEWPPDMLYAAGVLTLAFASQLLDEGLGLKDATPYNVLFAGPNPVFIDVPSVEQRDPADPTWLAYGQFVRTFLLPLIAYKYYGLSPVHVFTTRRDGLEPEEVYHWLSPLRRLLPPFLTLTSIPTWFGYKQQHDNAALYQKRRLMSPDKARFILRSLLDGLRSTLESLKPRPGKQSPWSNYAHTCHYSREDSTTKEAFVQQVLLNYKPQRLLDVGCNTGRFSTIAARLGTKVIAIDTDPVVVGELWRTARDHALPILPLVVSLARPSPPLGWCNQEQQSFLDRARGSFDAVFMLAVIHHILVGERIPLDYILKLAGELTSDILLVEFVGPTDPMFLAVARGREHLHSDLSEVTFEHACRRYFDIVRTQALRDLPRRMYLLKRR